MKWKMKFTLALVAYSIVILCNLYALPYDSTFRRLTIKEGLSQSVVNCMIQDHAGYIWAGTDDGLNRYNGTSFKVFRPSLHKKNSIADGQISSLLEDKQNNIWIGTYNGLSRLNTINYKISTYLKSSNNEVSNLQNHISCIFQDSNNNVWIGTENKIFLYNEEKDDFIDMSRRIFTDKTMISHAVTAIQEDHHGNLLFATADGLIEYNASTKNSTNYRLVNQPNIITIYCIYFDSSHRLWLGTSKGLFLRKAKNNFIRVLVLPDAHNQYVLIRSILEESKDLYLLATDNGLYTYHKNKGIINHFTSTIANQNTLCDNNINCMFIDKEQTTWLGTGLGISSYNDQRRRFHNIIGNPGTPFNPTSPIVWSIIEDNQHHLFLGTDDFGFSIFDLHSQKFITGNLIKNANHIKASVTAMAIDRNNNIYFGTKGYGVYIYSARTNQIQPLSKIIPHIKRHYFINDLYIDSKNRLWIASEAFISVFDGNKLITYSPTLSYPGFGYNDYSVILSSDKKGDIWFGSQYCAGKLNPETRKIVYFTHNEKDQFSISSNFITSIFCDNKDRVWGRNWRRRAESL